MCFCNDSSPHDDCLETPPAVRDIKKEYNKLIRCRNRMATSSNNFGLWTSSRSFIPHKFLYLFRNSVFLTKVSTACLPPLLSRSMLTFQTGGDFGACQNTCDNRPRKTSCVFTRPHTWEWRGPTDKSFMK